MFRNVIGFALTLALAPTAIPAQDDARPNILWITVEDLSPRIGAFGDTLAQTPNIDRLASEGVMYTNAFTTSGVCSPSRAAVFMGMYQTSFGAHHMRVTSADSGLAGPYLAVPPPNAKGFTEYLRSEGYYTANYGKTDYQVADQFNPREPLTAWDESVGYKADAIIEPVWRKAGPGQPFFIVMNTMRTHESRVWPDSTESASTRPESVAVPAYYPDVPAVRTDLARHYDNIRRMDTWVGEVLALLEEDGLASNTAVFFFTDHGDGLPRAKRWLYDSGLHVPLIVRWPEHLDAGATSDELVSFVDLAPTVLSMAGVPLPSQFQGRAFLGRARGPEPRFIFAARDRIDGSHDRVRAVRDKRFKLIRNFEPDLPYILDVPYRDRMPTMQELLRLQREGSPTGPVSLWLAPHRPAVELYDTDTDPYEVHNLAADARYSAVVNRMDEALREWQRETADMGAVPESTLVDSMWPGGIQPSTMAPEIRRSENLEVSISSETEGASIAYTMDDGEDPRWQLYTRPFRVDAPVVIRAVAVRYGFRTSPETRKRLAP